MQSAYHAVLAVKSEPARFRGINGRLPADAGPLHLFHDGRPALDLCARRDRQARAIPPQQGLEKIMSDKSHVSMERRICLVCAAPYETGAILLDKRLRAS